MTVRELFTETRPYLPTNGIINVRDPEEFVNIFLFLSNLGIDQTVFTEDGQLIISDKWKELDINTPSPREAADEVIKLLTPFYTIIEQIHRTEQHPRNEHGIHHIQQMVDDGEKLIKMTGQSEETTRATLFAIAFHDVGYLINEHRLHSVASYIIFSRIMPQLKNTNPDLYKQIRRAIVYHNSVAYKHILNKLENFSPEQRMQIIQEHISEKHISALITFILDKLDIRRDRASRNLNEDRREHSLANILFNLKRDPQGNPVHLEEDTNTIVICFALNPYLDPDDKIDKSFMQSDESSKRLVPHIPQGYVPDMPYSFDACCTMLLDTYNFQNIGEALLVLFHNQNFKHVVVEFTGEDYYKNSMKRRVQCV